MRNSIQRQRKGRKYRLTMEQQMMRKFMSWLLNVTNIDKIPLLSHCLLEDIERHMSVRNVGKSINCLRSSTFIISLCLLLKNIQSGVGTALKLVLILWHSAFRTLRNLRTLTRRIQWLAIDVRYSNRQSRKWRFIRQLQFWFWVWRDSTMGERTIEG